MAPFKLTYAVIGAVLIGLSPTQAADNKNNTVRRVESSPTGDYILLNKDGGMIYRLEKSPTGDFLIKEPNGTYTGRIRSKDWRVRALDDSDRKDEEERDADCSCVNE